MVNWMLSSRRPFSFLLVCCGSLSLCAAGVYVFSRPQAAQENNTQAQNTASTDKKEKKVDTGGVMRKQSDTTKVRPSRFDADRKINREARAGEQLRSAPKQPALALDSHPTVAKLHAKIMKGGDKDFSLHREPPPFNIEEFKKNKDEYLLEFAPNRIYQAAQPGPDVPPLASISGGTHAMNAGESVRLQVRTKAGYPATFVSLDLGTFQNKLNAITVEADDSGVAEASYSATAGTVNRSHVIVGSPGASGQVTFELQIRAPVTPGTAK